MANPLPSNQYTEAARQAAIKHGVPVEVMFGNIQQESGWNPSATNYFSKDGDARNYPDYGIAQLNTKYYPEAWTMTPEQQLDKSAEILSSNYKQFGNWYDAVRAYNAGPTGAARNPNLGKDHADKVLGYATSWGFAADSSNTGVAGTDSNNPVDYYLDGLKDLFDWATGKKKENSAPKQSVEGWLKANGMTIGIIGFAAIVIFFSTANTLRTAK